MLEGSLNKEFGAGCETPPGTHQHQHCCGGTRLFCSPTGGRFLASKLRNHLRPRVVQFSYLTRLQPKQPRLFPADRLTTILTSNLKICEKFHTGRGHGSTIEYPAQALRRVGHDGWCYDGWSISGHRLVWVGTELPRELGECRSETIMEVLGLQPVWCSYSRHRGNWVLPSKGPHVTTSVSSSSSWFTVADSTAGSYQPIT